ncbi:hypothetical protein FGU64_11520 [Mesorhizobium sp. 8]|nr:hypothetical protein FGU64_11520 [Mesorhizobium sp. 8]
MKMIIIYHAIEVNGHDI